MLDPRLTAKDSAILAAAVDFIGSDTVIAT
jgi:hypothetical protein